MTTGPSASARRRAGASRFLVTWGVLARGGFVVEHVEAHDPEEALVLAAARRPHLPAPRVAHLVGAAEGRTNLA